jgi:hypothetical protein
VFVTTNAGTSLMADRTGAINPGQFPASSIAIDPSDATGQTAYVTIMGFHVGHVFKTTNAGLTWADFSGISPNSIPDAPTNAVVVDASAGMIYVGTDVGVFVSRTSAASWTELGPKGSQQTTGYMPNVPVTALRIFDAGGLRLLRASTYGRGLWQYDLVPDYQISISNSIQTIFPGQTATFNGALTSANGYASPVAITCGSGNTAPPAICTPNQASVTPTLNGTSFSVTATDGIGDYIFNVHGEGTDAAQITHDVPLNLHVVDFGAPSPASVTVEQGGTSTGVTFLISGGGSFNGTITVSCPTGLPVGITCNFAPSASISRLPATVTLTFVAQAYARTGTTAITVIASIQGDAESKTQTVSLTVTPPIPDYRVTISNSPQSTPANQTATLNGVLQALNGYSSTVNLSCDSSAPPTCTISPASVAPGSAFTVSVSSGFARNYNFSINAIGTDMLQVSHTIPVTFNSLFTVSLTGSSAPLSVKAGQSAIDSLLVLPVGSNTFVTAVSFTCNGLPFGATCSSPLIPAGANGTQTVSLVISTSGPPTSAIGSHMQSRISKTFLLIWTSTTGMLLGWLSRKPKSAKKAVRVGIIGLAMTSILLMPSCGGGNTNSSQKSLQFLFQLCPMPITQKLEPPS